MEHETDQGHVMMRRSRILRGLLLCCLLALLAFLPTVSLAQTVSFGTATNFPVGSNPFSVAVGDFNGDGRLDLAVANQGSNTVSILLGTGDGTFEPERRVRGGNDASFMVAADVNGDGKLDLVIGSLSNFTRNYISVLLGN